MSSLMCVVGVDTGVGKTVVVSALLRAALASGVRARGVKPVQTGMAEASDAAEYARAAAGVSAVTLEGFEKPCSPHLAAALEGRRLNAGELAARIRAEAADGDVDWVVVEGAGGWLTPINGDETLADVMVALGAPVVVVAANRLGVLNHALLTLESVRARGLRVAALVLNEVAAPCDALIARDNFAALCERAETEVLELRFCPSWSGVAWDELAGRLAPLVQRLARREVSGEGARLLTFDREHVWHPYAGVGTEAPVWEAARTEGVRIFLADGRGLVDGMASWWSVIHGYNHPAMVRVIRQQAGLMPHVMFGGLTHAPAVGLAEKLLALAPDNLRHVFFADSGSVSVEVALKMAVQCQGARGCPERRRILAPRGGYHGDTLGAMSVGDPTTGRHGRFAGVLPEQVFVERPACRFDAAFDARTLEDVRAAFARHGNELAAAIVEPIVQGAGGMWFYHPEWLRGLAALCREHGVLLIFDEIATGFGRTGKMFAAEWAGVQPDILCVGKALTGGVMTLAATLCAGDVARDISANGGVMMHGPTFMANPLACAAAGASLDLLAEGRWRGQVARIASRLEAGLASLRGKPGVADVRVLGGIGVVEMAAPVNVGKLQQFFVDKHNVWLRPFGRLIYVMPPYVIGDDDLARLTNAMCAAVEEGVWAG